MYKIYNQETNEAIFAATLSEVRNLTDATDEQIKKLFYQGVVAFGGVEVITARRYRAGVSFSLILSHQNKNPRTDLQGKNWNF